MFKLNLFHTFLSYKYYPPFHSGTAGRNGICSTITKAEILIAELQSSTSNFTYLKCDV